MDHTYAVIMAGGGGTRLWPVSRKESPKQLLPFLGQETLFQSTVNRLENLFPPERILVVTVAEQARQMKMQAPAIPAENYILEPDGFSGGSEGLSGYAGDHADLCVHRIWLYRAG
jgi:mannose-1-phosphate guanylyltransferase